jgi:hypothetical protein
VNSAIPRHPGPTASGTPLSSIPNENNIFVEKHHETRAKLSGAMIL